MGVRRQLVASVVIAGCVCAAAPAMAQGTQAHGLMPVPARVRFEGGSLPLDARFGVTIEGARDPLLDRAVERTLLRITRLTGLPVVRSGGATALTIKCARPAAGVRPAIEDESYTLKVSSAGAVLTAATTYGALHGLETFIQLIEQGPTGFAVRGATIDDVPRFPWRGLLIDVCRHWIPPDVIKRNLNAMAAVKLNVLHWHLSEDQGFRVESKVYPLLHEKGSDGLYYTQDQVREIVRYAADRGIRVVPEFDMPGHTGAWLVGYPWLSSGKGPFEIGRTWGVYDPVLDPTNEKVYTFVDRLIGEMAGLFPDAFFHIGGDEVNGKQWDASPAVVSYRKQHAMATNEDLQAFFNTRVSAMLARRGKIMVGWEEVLHKDLPRSAVVHSWRGQKSLADAAAQGYKGILSNGYYLDYIWPAAQHYAVDPMGKDAANLPEEARKRILGGEACMWAEWVTPETIDSRIWPRTAAIAERYWSPASVTDVGDMYYRLGRVSRQLDATGVIHRSNYAAMLDRLANDGPTEALRGIVDLVEPVKNYNRGRRATFTSQTALNRLVDVARPESDEARAFGQLVDRYLADPSQKETRDAITAMLMRWQVLARDVQPAMSAPLLEEAAPLVQNVSTVSGFGLRAVESLQKKWKLALSTAEADALNKAIAPVADVLLMVAPHVKKLVDAAGKQQ
jgi:hexosaminidase